MNKLFFANILPGTLLFNRFVAIRLLSATDLGGVYLCHRKENKKELVALKILSSKANFDTNLSASFLREVEMSYRVRHPNVLAIKEFYNDEDFTALCMDYVSGGTLADLMKNKKKLEIPRITNILLQLCRGLQAIHDAEIVHNDLKPENILINAEGRIHIADFGISTTGPEHEPSAERQIIGSMNYLSPELISKGTSDYRSDIYALGVIAYQLITGKLPFQGKNVLESLCARVRFDPTPPERIRSKVPKSLSNLTLKAMQRNPDRRYQSVKDVMQDLQKLVDESLGKDDKYLDLFSLEALIKRSPSQA